MAYDLIKISGLPLVTPDSGQDIVVGVGDYAKRINYGDVKNDMVGTSPTYTTDTEPYLMRRTAHTGVVGKCALNKLVGGSLGWNQLNPNDRTTGSSNSVSASKDADGVWTLTGTASPSTALINPVTTSYISLVQGHAFYLVGCPSGGTVTTYQLDVRKDGNIVNGAIDVGNGKIFKTTVSGNHSINMRVASGATVSGIKYTPQLFDLTQMLGTTIADYLYTLESGTAGAGVAKLKEWGFFTSSGFNAYDVGSVQSVQTTAHVTTGKNLFDPNFSDWVERSAYRSLNNIIPENTDARFTFTNKDTSVSISGINLGFWGGTMPTSGSPTYFNWVINNGVVQTNKTNTPTGLTVKCRNLFIYPKTQATLDALLARYNIMVELGTTATAYVPYEKYTYPLGSDTLRGIPQLVSNKLSYDGDIKTPDGTITRKYGYIDLGTLTWNKHGTYTNCFGATLSGINAPSPSNTCAPCVCARYVAVYGADITLARITSTDSNGCAFLSPSRWSTANPTIVINDVSHTSSTAEQFKAAMSGVYLVFPLTTETTESSTAYQKVQTIDADGTESFTTSSPVPVGHETQTPDNILAALGWLGE